MYVITANGFAINRRLYDALYLMLYRPCNVYGLRLLTHNIIWAIIFIVYFNHFSFLKVSNIWRIFVLNIKVYIERDTNNRPNFNDAFSNLIDGITGKCYLVINYTYGNIYLKFYWTNDSDVWQIKLWPCDAIWWQRSRSTSAHAGDGLLPDGTKPFPESILTYR